MKRDVYQEVTNRIVEALEQGTVPWVKPWTTTDRVDMPLRHNGQPYQGVNVLILWLASSAYGYQSNTWMTYKQAEALGGQVRKGEKGQMICFAKPVLKSEEVDGKEVNKSFFMMKAYTVFNVDQIDGLPEKYAPVPVEPLEQNPDERVEVADKFIASIEHSVKHGGAKACYIPSVDRVEMPEFSHFQNATRYYSTYVHELGHWTGHKSRLDRDLSGRFGTESYAMEELVAEMTAAFTMAHLGLPMEVKEDHASYIAHWLKVLKDDKKAIFTAASAATKAAEHLASYQEAGA